MLAQKTRQDHSDGGKKNRQRPVGRCRSVICFAIVVLLTLFCLLYDGQNVRLFHNQKVFTLVRDLGASVAGEDNAIANTDLKA